MLAQKDAEEKRIAAQAEQVRAAVAAEAQKLLYEAENVLTDGARYGLFRRRLLDRIEGIVRESVKPMEKIEGIQHPAGRRPVRRRRRSRRRPQPHRRGDRLGAALPRAGADDRQPVLKEIGIEGGSLSRLAGLMREASDMQRVAKEAGAGSAQRREAAPPPGRPDVHPPDDGDKGRG